MLTKAVTQPNPTPKPSTCLLRVLYGWDMDSIRFRVGVGFSALKYLINYK